MIALAMACNPTLLIADEPTTALDVTIQAQILALIQRLQKETGMSVLFITHNLGVVAQYADHVAVMYAGRIVETAAVGPLFATPRHPYTRGLLACLPGMAARGGRGGPCQAAPDGDQRPGVQPVRTATRLRLRAALSAPRSRMRCRHAAAGCTLRQPASALHPH